MSRFYACMSDDVRRTCVTSRLFVLYLITLILLLLIQLPILTQTAHAQTTYDEPYGLIELSEIPTPDQRTALSDAGITLLDYLYGSTWTASFDTPIDPAQIEVIVSVEELQPLSKVSPLFSRITDLTNPDSLDTEMRVNVTTWDRQSRDYLQQYGVIIETNSLYTTVQISEGNLNDLLEHSNTQWVEPVFATHNLGSPETENLSVEAVNVRYRNILELTNSDSLVASLEDGGLGLTGQGGVTGIFDDGRVYPHHNFGDKLTYQETFTIPTSIQIDEPWDDAIDPDKVDAVHATAVAGVVHLIAPNTHLNSYFRSDTDPLDNNDIDLLVLANSPRNCETAGTYTLVSQIYDLYELPLIFSAGNHALFCVGTHPNLYGTISSGKQSSKNGITLGAIQDALLVMDESVRGSTKDGRIAPTFVMPGENILTICPRNYCGWENGGTSFSAAGLGGIASLLLEAYRSMVNDSTATLSSADLRALFAATATDMGLPGPDNLYGFGLINGGKAAEALTNLHRGKTDGGNEPLDGITIPVDENTDQLNVALAWNDVPFHPMAAELGRNDFLTTTVLVNDLEIRVTAPDGTIHHPLVVDIDTPAMPAREGVDSVNTIEQIVVDRPQAGDWIVTVTFNGRIITDSQVGDGVIDRPQRYSVAYMTTPADSSTPLIVSLAPLSASATTIVQTIPLIILLSIASHWSLRRQYRQ